MKRLLIGCLLISALLLGFSRPRLSYAATSDQNQTTASVGFTAGSTTESQGATIDPVIPNGKTATVKTTKPKATTSSADGDAIQTPGQQLKRALTSGRLPQTNEMMTVAAQILGGLLIIALILVIIVGWQLRRLREGVESR
ncbi:hypothetical protein MUDAN_DOGOELCO_02670 [Lactiplantibacillus mudanjiangensis]|uniref:hypothetical protein n=1 Tax=Lactiplantibacillus mudanjiangensis TaxID=1296538 RepID=UPI0010158D90|nr:hypothetical protein [Lactiplantibacillus mudanjiangensis]VDG33504.1 hypothetical protein MUDAN_DOGOELCO_02670 [Lactiplantibacillus mudanjiangensis]